MVTQELTNTALRLVDDARRRTDITNSELSARSGIARTTLNRKLAGDEDFKLTELARISDALGAKYSAWLRELARVAS